MLIRRSGITPREIKIWQHLSYCMNLIKMIDSTEKKRIKNVRQYLEVDTLWHISRAKTWVVRKLKIYLVQIQDLKSVSRHQLQSKKLLVFFVNFLEVLLVFYFKLIEVNFVKYFSHFFFLQFAPNFIWSQRRNRILVRMHISQVRAKVVVGNGHRIFSHQLFTTSVIFVSKKRQKTCVIPVAVPKVHRNVISITLEHNTCKIVARFIPASTASVVSSSELSKKSFLTSTFRSKHPAKNTNENSLRD